MALNTMDKLVAAMCASTAQRKSYIKNVANVTLSQWHSLWTDAGNPGAGATPTAASSGGDVPTSSTTGAIPGLVDPAGADVLYLARAEQESDAPFGWLLFDRLWQCSGFSGTSVGVQSVTSPVALTRPDANGNGTELWLEVYTVTGATPQTATATYTNSAGTGSRTATATLFGNPEIGAMSKFKLQAGDTGVKSVQSVQLGGSTGTAGNWGLTILRRLATVPMVQRQASYQMDVFNSGMPTLDAGACLAMAILGGNLTATLTSGQLAIIEG